MLQLLRNRQTATLTWAASSTVAADIAASGAITRMVLRLAITPSGSMASNWAVDGLQRVIDSLTIKGSGGVNYFSMGNEQIGRMLHDLAKHDGLIKGMGHGAMGTPIDIVFPIHFGSRPFDGYGRANPFDLSAFIPAFDDSELKLEWATTANAVMDAAVTISSIVGYLTVYQVMGTAQQIKREMARQGVARSMVPVSSYKAYPHTANLSDLGSQHDIPTGNHLRRIVLLVQDDTATRPLRADDEVASIGIILPTGNQRIFQDDFRNLAYVDGGIASLAEADAGVTTGPTRTQGGFAVLDFRNMANPDYGMDLRPYKTGDVKLGLTIENYASGDDTFMWYDQVRGYDF